MYMNGIVARLHEDLRISPASVGDGQNMSGDEMKVRVEYSIQEGKTAENIVNFAHAENIDLLVISSHGSGGLSRWNVSSVTQKVINKIYLPVLIVRAYTQPGIEHARIHYRRILLPIDSSRRAESALPAGIALAQRDLSTLAGETKLILAGVIKPPEVPIPDPHPSEIDQLAEQLVQISRLAVSNYLNEIKDRLPVECEICVLENNDVSLAIQEMAGQEEDIDLVVLSAHGYTGRSTWPYGSVARNLMEHGTKPVLVIQDVLRSQVRPTAAEIAAEKSGSR
jgi:nucleotide-binding universal stress UspA family protein